MKLWFHRGVRASKKAHGIVNALQADKVKKIAVVRHAALGDMMLTRPFLIEARKAFPNAVITLSTVSNYTRGTPDDLVNRVHIMHGSDKKHASISERIRNARELGEQDIIFDLAASNRSTWLCLLTRAKLKIGFPYKRFHARFVYDIAIHRSDLDFEVNDMLKQLNIFGIKTAYPHQFAMPGDALRRDSPYVVYFIGASTPDKCWPHDHFAGLIDRMASRWPDHDHLVLEGIQKWETADKILEHIGERTNVTRFFTDTIEATTSLIKGADMVVSNDTGIRHIAIASDTPTAGIFYADPFRYWPRYGYHDIALPRGDAAHPSVEDMFIACNGIMQQL